MSNTQEIDFVAMRANRLSRMKKIMRQMGIGTLLTFDPNTICYLADITVPNRFQWMENFFVILPVNGDPEFYGYGVHDLLENAPWLHGKVWSSVAFTRLYSDPERMDPIVDRLINAVYEHSLEKLPVAIDGCTSALTLRASLEKLDIALVDGRRCVNQARLIKCPEELECMRRSAQISETIFRHIRELIRPGVYTGDVMALSMEGLVGQNITSVVEHSIISGPQTNPPLMGHVNRRLENGDLVHVAVNCNVYHGYKTYYYRTFCCGYARVEQMNVYEKTLRLLRECIAPIKQGAQIAEVLDMWETYPEQWGYDRYDKTAEFCTCHGIGLATFEYPSFSTFDPGILQTLEDGMVLDVYTWGGYKGGTFGVRLGENIIVTQDGYELLSTYPADRLIECGID